MSGDGRPTAAAGAPPARPPEAAGCAPSSVADGCAPGHDGEAEGPAQARAGARRPTLPPSVPGAPAGFASRPDLAGARGAARRARGENFPVALRILPARHRAELLAIYAFARMVDDIGDEAEGDRCAALGRLEACLDEELAAAGDAGHDVSGTGLGAPAASLGSRRPSDAVVAAAASVVRARGLDPQLLRDLIQANRQDQVVQRYETWDALLGYCRLSANPVGRLVLGIFDSAGCGREERSDAVCSALQVVEHLQDVAEDAARGRVYLPAEDLRSFEVAPAELLQPVASPALRRLVAFEAARAGALVDHGAPLVSMVHGAARFAVAGFVAGGRAALDSLAAARYDVLATRCRPRRSRVARHAARLVVAGASSR